MKYARTIYQINCEEDGVARLLPNGITIKEYTSRSKATSKSTLALRTGKFYSVWLLVLVAKTNKLVRIDVIVDAFLVCTYSGCSLPEKRSHGSYQKNLDWTEDERGPTPSLWDAARRAAAAWPAEGSTSLVVEKGEDGGDADAARSYHPLAHHAADSAGRPRRHRLQRERRTNPLLAWLPIPPDATPPPPPDAKPVAATPQFQSPNRSSLDALD